MPVSTRPRARWRVPTEWDPDLGISQSAKTLQFRVNAMRDLSMEDGFGPTEVGEDGPAGEADEQAVSDLASDGLDVGFDFLSGMDPVSERATDAAAANGSASEAFDDEDVAEFRARWADIQASFIDDPRRACEQADNLVDLVLTRLTEGFTKERNGLVRAWDRGSEPTDTEDLRLAIKGYRGLIDRLLTTEL